MSQPPGALKPYTEEYNTMSRWCYILLDISEVNKTKSTWFCFPLSRIDIVSYSPALFTVLMGIGHSVLYL